MADRGLTGASSLAYMGVRPSTPPQLVIHPRKPKVTDYLSFCLGDIWMNNAGTKLTPPVPPGPGDVYMLVSVARNVATWIPLIGGLLSLFGDFGVHVFGDANSNINIVSDIPNLHFTGVNANHTLTLASFGDEALAEIFYTDDHHMVNPTNDGEITITGAGGITTQGAGSVITITGAGVGPVLHAGHDINFTAPDTTVNVNNAITLGDLAVVTAGNPSVTLQSGDLTISGTGINAGGNITIPQTNTAGTQGVIFIQTPGGPVRFIHNGGGGINHTNTFIGHTAGSFTADVGNTAYQNVGVGASALRSLTPGGGPNDAENNTAIGAGALAAVTSGQANCGVGTSMMFSLTTGSFNLGLGFAVASHMITGSYNTLIGYLAGDNLVGAESNNTYLDNAGITGESNAMRLGTTGPGDILKTYIAGIRGVTTDIPDAIVVFISSDGQVGTMVSSIRYKDNVQDMGSDSDNILNLRPVTFEYKKHPGIKQYGLIAEEVAEHMPRLVVYDQEGLPETVKYHDLPVILLNEIQKLVKRVAELEKKLDDTKS